MQWFGNEYFTLQGYAFKNKLVYKRFSKQVPAEWKNREH